MATIYRVRRGMRADLARVRRIFLDALEEHGFLAIESNVNQEIKDFGLRKDPTQEDFVATFAGRTIGFAILTRPTTGTAELSKVFVKPSHRRHGVATMLIDGIIARARHHGCRGVVLESHAVFKDACAYYERRGWVRGPDLPDALSPTRTYSLKLL